MTELLDKPCLAGEDAGSVVRELRALAIRALARMYRPEQRLFAFRLHRVDGLDVLEGVSGRYTATVLLALAGETPETAAGILAGQDAGGVCTALIEGVQRSNDLGEVALTLWAARALQHPAAGSAFSRLRSMEPETASCPTVELAWSLSALAVDGASVGGEPLAGVIAERLLSSFNRRSRLFPHWPAGAGASLLRSHVTCFADLVYPIQALSHYHLASGHTQALDVARQCAERMCELQGPEGQWWWHYDARTGRVLERFPVYSVHQDAMAPMALFALQAACGQDHIQAIERSIRWLVDPPEADAPLVDTDSDVIWRKVARREPAKLARTLQAAASRVHPGLRAPGVNALLRPGRIDYESRPYHMGWILHAWPTDRVVQAFRGDRQPRQS